MKSDNCKKTTGKQLYTNENNFGVKVFGNNSIQARLVGG